VTAFQSLKYFHSTIKTIDADHSNYNSVQETNYTLKHMTS